MIIIHYVKPLPRLVGNVLAERLRVMPAVVVTGARQSGKSTLAEQLVPGRRRYSTLDDLDVLDAARLAGSVIASLQLSLARLAEAGRDNRRGGHPKKPGIGRGRSTSTG
jgi:predicted AAA+ superfamily ATPase